MVEDGSWLNQCGWRRIQQIPNHLLLMQIQPSEVHRDVGLHIHNADLTNFLDFVAQVSYPRDLAFMCIQFK